MPKHKRGFAVRAVISDQRGRCLLVRRSNSSKWFAGTWEWPGGKVDSGETYDVALHREVAEETGLEIELSGVAGAYSMEVAGRQIAVLCLEAACIRGDVCLSEEHDDSVWAPMADLLQWELAPDLRKFADEYIQRTSDGG